MIYSDAAKAYAENHHGDSVPGDWYCARDSVRAFVRAAFDAGAASAPAASRPLVAWERELLGEPVLLTADDPRWRDGAKVRGEFADGTAIEGILIRREIRYGDPDYYYLYTGNLAAVYLLAEAPDPDAELIADLEYADQMMVDREEKWAPQVLKAVRAAGYDVVKVT